VRNNVSRFAERHPFIGTSNDIQLLEFCQSVNKRQFPDILPQILQNCREQFSTHTILKFRKTKNQLVHETQFFRLQLLIFFFIQGKMVFHFLQAKCMRSLWMVQSWTASVSLFLFSDWFCIYIGRTIRLQFYAVANNRAVKAFFLSRIGIVKNYIDFSVADFCFELCQKSHFCLKSQYLLVVVAYKQVNIPAFFPIVGSRTKQVNGGSVPKCFFANLFIVSISNSFKRIPASL